MLGPLLWNIDICDMFASDSTCDIASYADENTPYPSNASEELVINNLEISCSDLFKLFRENHLNNANADKCHPLTSTNKLIKNQATISIVAISKNCSG